MNSQQDRADHLADQLADMVKDQAKALLLISELRSTLKGIVEKDQQYSTSSVERRSMALAFIAGRSSEALRFSGEIISTKLDLDVDELDGWSARNTLTAGPGQHPVLRDDLDDLEIPDRGLFMDPGDGEDPRTSEGSWSE